MNDRYILITGASTGIGKACALHLARKNFSVLAGIRKAQDGESLSLIAGPNLQPIQLDIADPDSIAAASAKIAEITGSSGLAGLVNNAGISVPAPMEFLTRDDWRKQFEVNVFGHVDLTRALLPLLRMHISAAGPGSARIIFIGSIAGRISMPILGAYSASKHAIASIASSLRMELKPQTIHVCLIEPGAIQSEIWKKGDEVASNIPTESDAHKLYGRVITAVLASAHDSAAAAIPADQVARLVHQCLTHPRPPRRRTVGRDAWFAALLRRILPERAFDKVLMKALKVK